MNGETNGEVDVVAGHGWSWLVMASPPCLDSTCFFPSLDMTISLHEQLRYGPMKGGPLEQSQQWKLSDDSKYSRQNPPTQKTKKKVALTSISSDFSMVLS